MPLLLIVVLLGGLGWLSRERIGRWLLERLNAPPPTATLQEVQRRFASGNLEQSIAGARALLAQDAGNVEALVLLLRALVYRSYEEYNTEHEREAALQLSEQALSRNPSNLKLQGIHAFVLQANGFSDEAAQRALRIIQRDPESITARLSLSLAYGSQGIFSAALREGERAVQIAEATAPGWRADAYRVLAIAYSDLGRYEQAASAAETALSHQRRLLPLHFERALYAVQIGDMDTATAHYFNVLAFDEDNVKARFRLCELSSTLREHDAAISWCTEVTEFAPGWADGWYQLGREYYLQGNMPLAQQSLHRCSTLQVAQGVPIEERRFECWYLQGQAAEVLGDCDALLPLYDEFTQMAESAQLEQRWQYPPGGPPVCATPTAFPQG